MMRALENPLAHRTSCALSIASLMLCMSCESSGGEGTASFTTWGEDYIEQGIPADPAGQAGFIDGWTLHYDKFLVVFHEIKVADSKGEVAAELEGSRFVDNTKPGRKKLVSFPHLDAREWDAVSYQIKPAKADSEVVSGSAADRDMMVKNGFSLYVEGKAQKTEQDGKVTTKTFHWGFKTATQYNDCQQPEISGQAIQGIVVTNGGNDVSELTTHGDHLYYDRLMASPDPAVKTSLRFQQKADADADMDGEITLKELDAMHIDVRLYDPSGLDAPSLGAFMTSLARTVGHFRGEGECTISRIE
jgi:hypothetical protein